MLPVLNKHTDEIPPGAAYVMRPGTFGNPYRITPTLTRERAIANFKRDWYRRVAADPAFRRAALELKKASALVCVCVPLPCHAQIIAEWLDAQP